MIRAAAALAILLALFLGACGGDSSDKDKGRTQPAAAPDDGSTGSSEDRRRQDPADSNEETLQLDERQAPVPKGSVPLDERSGTAPRYTRPKQLPKERLQAIERPVYEQSRYLCRRMGVEGMRREYRIESSDPQDVARRVAANTYQREIRDAVYSGCLAGLRAGE